MVIGESKGSSRAAWELSLIFSLNRLENELLSTEFSFEEKARRQEWVKAVRDAVYETGVLRDGVEVIQEDSRASKTFNAALAQFAKAMNIQGGHYTVDAACASSLAALGAAVRELRLGKTQFVIAGGVGVSVTPAYNVPFSACGALSGTGSKPFDATADGIVLGEGSVVFALKRLDEAEKAGNKIFGILKGIGSSSDGREASMMAPSAEGQALAMKRALGESGYGPHEIQWIECHATGTRVGDESELDAIEIAYGERRPGDPIYLSAIKSQIGHTIGAAGAAGMLHILLGMQRKLLPTTRIETQVHRAEGNLALQTRVHPGLRMATRRIPLKLSRASSQWTPSGGKPRRAAVSAFGFGGTNWHAILEEAGRDKIAFLFPGHGSPYPNMGVQFYRKYAVFRQTIRDANEVVEPILGVSIEKMVFTESGTSVDEIQRNFLRTDRVQPLILAFDIAFYRLLREFGLCPDFYLGHSVGDIAAAVASGGLSLEAGLHVMLERGRIFRKLQEERIDVGGMLALFISSDPVKELLQRIGAHEVSIANINSPTQTVVSGTSSDLDQVAKECNRCGIDFRRLKVTVAWHSRLAGRLGEQEFARVLEGISVDEDRKRRWISHLSSTVDFVSDVQTLHRQGGRIFIEVGPSTLLSGFVEAILKGHPHRTLASDSVEDIGWKNLLSEVQLAQER